MGVEQVIFKNNQAPQCEDKHLNAFVQEINNVISSFGLSIDANNFSQLAQSIFIAVSTSSYYQYAGSPNAINLLPISGQRGPSQYFDGMECVFRSTQPNTGSATVNVNNLGTKVIKTEKNTDLIGREISGYTTIVYSKADDAFFYIPYLTTTNFIQNVPVGVPLPWPTDVAPTGFAIMKGQSFDTNIYTELASVFPSGTLWDMRGVGVLGKQDGETVGVFEYGQVKSHGHPGSSASDTDIGSKTTNTTGEHNHTIRSGANEGHEYDVNARHARSSGTQNTSTDGNHNHSVDIGSHGHSLTIASFGAAKNTFDHRKVNWIVRMA